MRGNDIPAQNGLQARTPSKQYSLPHFALRLIIILLDRNELGVVNVWRPHPAIRPPASGPTQCWHLVHEHQTLVRLKSILTN